MPPRRPQPKKLPSEEELSQLLNRLKSGNKPFNANYREQSLKIHGWICAKCGREFERESLQLLTVHHKDGNHHNNPKDGSNWENLCVYCHDDEHSRSILAEYLNGTTP